MRYHPRISPLALLCMVCVGAAPGCENVVTDRPQARGDPAAAIGDPSSGAGDSQPPAGDLDQEAGDPALSAGDSAPPLQGCDGQTDGSLQVRVRYAAESVPPGAPCDEEVQTRTCHDGTWTAWSGTYQYPTCVSRTPLLTITGDAASEGDTLLFVVTLSEFSLRDVPFTWAVVPGTASSADFLGDGGSAAILAGELSALLALETVDDDVCEGEETLSVVLQACDGCQIPGTGVAPGLIREDDFPLMPQISIASATAAEGEEASFTVSLACPARHAVEISWIPLSETATAGDDFPAAPGTLTIPAYSTSGTLHVPIIDDDWPEPPETFLLHIDGVSGGLAPAGPARGTIARSDMHAWTAGGATGAAVFLALHGGAVYVAGNPGLNHNSTSSWRVEKRDGLSGTLAAGFGGLGVLESDPSPGSDPLAGIGVSAQGLYLAGSQSDGTLSHWRVEKRDLATGMLDTDFGQGGVEANTDETGTLNALALDGSGLFLAGQIGTARIEKRDPLTGLRDAAFGAGGAITPSLTQPLIVLAAGWLYVVGRRVCGSYGCVVIERRDLLSGALDPSFGAAGQVELGGGQYGMQGPQAIAASADAIFILGYTLYLNPPLLAKRSLSDGAAIPAFDGDGLAGVSALSAYPMDVAVNASGVYLSGWRLATNRGTAGFIERRDVSTGALIARWLHDPSGESYLGTGGKDGLSAVALGEDLVITAGASGAPDPSYPERTWWYVRRVFLDP